MPEIVPSDGPFSERYLINGPVVHNAPEWYECSLTHIVSHISCKSFHLHKFFQPRLINFCPVKFPFALSNHEDLHRFTSPTNRKALHNHCLGESTVGRSQYCRMRFRLHRRCEYSSRLNSIVLFKGDLQGHCTSSTNCPTGVGWG